MDRLRRLLTRPSSPAYEPLNGETTGDGDERSENTSEQPFSWLTYGVFFLLGIAMLWAWNMFLAATPYFQRRFHSNEWIRVHFLSAIIFISTITNLVSVLALAKLQSKTAYPRRITSSLIINIISFMFLTLSTVLFRHVSAGGYFAFMLLIVFTASLATGLSQNGVFAYASGFGRREYTQAIMTGQAVAGVLPCIAQIVSVLSIPAKAESGVENVESGESSRSAFLYFLASTTLSAATLVAFLYLLLRERRFPRSRAAVESSLPDSVDRKAQPVSMRTLFRKLRWLALAVFTCFAVTMVFPVFTKGILSIRPADSAPSIFEPAVFIPLAFLFWNIGDLLGRLSTLIPALTILSSKPYVLFVFSIARLIFIPLYMLCNRHGNGAVVRSDLFYLVVVQLGFGLTNGWLGSSCMMGAAHWVDVDEREAAGGFMGLMLVAGLTAGSLLSFFVAGV